MHAIADRHDPAEVNAYMGAGKTEIEDSHRKEYWTARYETIQKVYRGLLLAKEEAEMQKDERTLDTLTKEFRENYKDRVCAVTELIRLGIPVEDKYVPKSKAAQA